MNVLLVTTDLLAGSQFAGAAQSAGATLATVGPRKAAERAAELAPRLVVLELASPLGDVAGLVAELKSAEPAPAVVAFGPHVQEAKLQAAADAGCDAVLTRGQFHRSAGELIARYAAASSDDTDAGAT